MKFYKVCNFYFIFLIKYVKINEVCTNLIYIGEFMKRKFYNLSLWLIITTSVLSVLFSIGYYIASERIDSGATLLTVFYYMKKAVDLIAIFTGYGSIIYAFSRYSKLDGIKVLGIFAISFLISFFYQVIGTCFYESDFALEFILFTTYYAFGDCFITQFVPALLIALFSYKATKNGTKRIEKFVSWKNPTQRTMLIITLVIFAINFVALLIFDILAFLIEAEWMIYASELGSIFLSILEAVIIYVVVQYAMYMLMHYIYNKYTDEGGSSSDAEFIKVLTEE